MPENPNADPETGSEYIYGPNVAMATNSTANNRRHSAHRVSSAGNGTVYYDIATQLLGKQGSDLEELFIAAARDGLYEKIENFLQRNRNDYVVSIDVKDKRTGNTPLIWAAKRGHAKIVQLLLRHGADITLRNYEGHTAVEVASPSIRTILLESVERGTEATHHLLLQAAWQGDIKVVARLLLSKKVLDINCQNADGFTPIMLATRDMLLFERLSTQMSRTYNPVEVVSELMSARCDIHAADSDGKTCLHHAAQSKATIAQSVVSTIISGGPNLEQKDKRCFTPIHCASLTGNAECISSLLEGGSEVNSRGFAGATPLHITSYNNHEKATDVLLGHGANVTITDDRGLTPYDFAKTRKMKKKLQEAWAEVTNNRSSTSLGPIRAPSREDLRTSIEDLTKKKKGEVIFEGLPSNPFSEASKKDALASGKGLTRHHSLKEKNGRGDEDSSTHSSSLHNNVRRLGQVRGQKPNPLPRAKSRSTERLPTISPDRQSGDRNLESPVSFGRNSRARRSFEDRKGRGRPVPLSTRERISAIADDVFDRLTPGPASPTPSMQHRRSDSDPNRSTPNLRDIAASCDPYLQTTNRRGRSYSQPVHDLTSDPTKFSNQREATGSSLQREATLMSICSYRTDSRMSTNSTSPRLLNLGQMLSKAKTPVQNMPLYGPGSNKVIPPTPTFITQRNPSSQEGKSEFDQSPRSDEDLDIYKDTMDRPELLRSRTIFKEEFVLEDSRPKDPYHCSSGSGRSDTVSSSGSSPSPREASLPKNDLKGKSGTNQQKSQPGKSSANSAKYVVSSASANKGNNVNEKTSAPTGKQVGLKKFKVSNVSDSNRNVRERSNISSDNGSFAAAVAMKRAGSGGEMGVQNSAKPKGKLGGSIMIHRNNDFLIDRAKVDAKAKSANKNANTNELKEDTSDNIVADHDKHTEGIPVSNPDVANNASASGTAKSDGASAKENKTLTQVKKTGNGQKQQKTDSVLHVVPTKLTENIIRTVPKTAKDKPENVPTTKCLSSKTENKAEPAKTAQVVSNYKMKLSPSAQVVNRCAETPTKLSGNSDSKQKAVENTSDPVPTTQSKDVNQEKTAEKTASNSSINESGTSDSGKNKTNAQPVSNKNLKQTASAQQANRSGAQSRNSNLNNSRSAGSYMRQTNNVKKPGSNYVPRFQTAAVSKGSETKQDSSQNKSGNVSNKSAADNVETKAAQSTVVEPKAGLPSSPTENVPSSVCKSSSLLKSYNMSSVPTKPSTSVNTPLQSKQATESGKTADIKKTASGLSKSTSEALTGAGKVSSASIVSKSIAQMPGVGRVGSENEARAGLVRSSSMSTFEKEKEKKQMSSSDTNIQQALLSNQKRPASDGPDSKENIKAPLLPVDSGTRLNLKNYVEATGPMTTPVIVNPFEELEQKREEEKLGRAVTATEFGFVIEKPANERSKTQTSLKGRNIKSAKKIVNTKDAKAVTNVRGSSAKRKRPRSKDPNKSDTESNRPKSGKSGRRVRSGRRKRKVPDNTLANESEQSDVALIGGIGWHLATSCIDKSDADAVVVSQITSSESESEDVDVERISLPLNLEIPQNSHLNIPNSIDTPTSLSSPRFREVRSSKVETENLPYMDDDGYPPMNLDMTQQNRSGVFIDQNVPDDIGVFLAKLKEQESEGFEDQDDDSDDYSYDLDNQYLQDVYHQQALIGKLTPIPESPAQTNTSSSPLRVARTVDAIKKFDQSVQESELNSMLGATPRDISSGSVRDYSSMSVEKNAINSSNNSSRGSGGTLRSGQSPKDSKSVYSGSAKSRAQPSRSSSSRTNVSRVALASGNSDRTITTKTESSQNKSESAKTRNSIFQNPNQSVNRSAKSKESRQSMKNPENIPDKSTQNLHSNESVKDNVHSADSKSASKNSRQQDFKQLLADKMQKTQKMLEESNANNSRAKSAANSKHAENHESSKDKHVDEEVPVTVPNLDIHGLNTDRTDDESKSNRSSRRERRYSETKVVPNKEDDIEEVIDEILNTTYPSGSHRSLKSQNSLRSASSTLTEADRKVLMKLSQENSASPFHAKESSVRVSSSYDESVTLNKDNPELMKRFQADNFKMGQKVKAMIDAGADSARLKAMVKSDNEAKQLARIMNSFRQMELYAGPGSHQNRSSKRETPRVNGEFKSLSKFDHHTPHSGLPARPGSAGAGKIKPGKFTEIKGKSASHLSDRPSSPSAVPKDLAEEFKRSRFVRIGSQQDMVNLEDLPVPDVDEDGDSSEDERAGSACTVSSTSSLLEDTIQWKKGNVLGKGAFGTVWCGLTSEGQLIAVKQIELNTNNQTKAKKEYEKVQEEVELLKTLEHKNIVGYLGTSLEDSVVSIFMQFVPGGSIASILARFGALDESVFRKYTRQILEGVEYLHNNDVIHRDIKGGNVMLMPTGVIKLIDFGCAKRLCINLSMGQSEILKSMKGTPYWMAPEVVNETGHGKKSDIWSIGCTVFEMATRKPPWADMNPMAAIFAIGCDKPVPQLPNKFSDEAIDFVNMCLSRDQLKRPSASELLQTNFIRRRTKKLNSSSSYC